MNFLSDVFEYVNAGYLAKRGAQMNTISVCILVKNEESNIVDAISSIKNIASEIIVVDNGSTDGTISLLSDMDCIVYHNTNRDLDAARTTYLHHATSDWVFVLDADERLEESHQKKLLQLLSQVSPDTWGIEITKLEYLGKGKFAENPSLRMIRNHVGIQYNKTKIHASFFPYIYSKNKKVISVDIFIHHLDAIQVDTAKNNHKRVRYLALLQESLYGTDCNAKDIHTRNLHIVFLALEYIARRDYEKAETLLMGVLQQNTRTQYFAISVICQLYVETGEYHKIKPFIGQLNEHLFADRSRSMGVLGNYYYHENKNKAIDFYRDDLLKYPNRVSSHINLAYLLSQKEKNAAKQLLQKAVSLNPYLEKKLIYSSGEEYSIFRCQSNILNVIDNVYDIFYFR